MDWCPLAWQKVISGMACFCGHKSALDVPRALPEAEIVVLLTWIKRNAAPTGANVPRYTSEFIWILKKAPGLKWGNLKQTHFDIPLVSGALATERLRNDDGSTAHPTQKPVLLLDEILNLAPSSVIDPFMGTGTTGVSCMKRGISFIGVEIREPYFKIACERIENAQRQERLFA